LWEKVRSGQHWFKQSMGMTTNIYPWKIYLSYYKTLDHHLHHA
jgi:hypothetical protein